jgi:hypothetical protein
MSRLALAVSIPVAAFSVQAVALVRVSGGLGGHIDIFHGIFNGNLSWGCVEEVFGCIRRRFGDGSGLILGSGS